MNYLKRFIFEKFSELTLICEQKQKIIRNNTSSKFQILKVTINDIYDKMGRINYQIIAEISNDRADIAPNIFYLDESINPIDYWKKVISYGAN